MEQPGTIIYQINKEINKTWADKPVQADPI